ncbi:hypothetical protein BC937DRAFT_87680 [Endogone sp. FLAS-F59071]|nr:hypothetical protein BC937DRAFT_87680 [Endogone sp. FLAS-F59071]|eukprot:RUS22698.1 hypothetical protein BC937DRAFT_87680 [Endogone sp. FLAS-F59071]
MASFRHPLILQTLPIECTLEICCHLDLRSLLSIRVTSRSLHQIITLFQDTLATHFIQRDIINPTQARRIFPESSQYPLVTMKSLCTYATLMHHQRIAIDILQLLLGDMGVPQPRAVEHNLARIYTLWEVLQAWRKHMVEGRKDPFTYEESTAIQIQILRELQDGELSALVSTVGALTGALCGRCAASGRRDDTAWGMAFRGMLLEDRVSFIISEGLETVYNVLFGDDLRQKTVVDNARGRRATRSEGTRWFLFRAALEVMGERGLISRWEKALQFASVSEYIRRRSEGR